MDNTIDDYHMKYPTTVSGDLAALRGGFVMSKSFKVLASSLIIAMASLAPLAFAIGHAAARDDRDAPRLAGGSPYLYPSNVVCKDFEKTGFRTWRIRTEAEMDLGNWDGVFLIRGAIQPSAFVSKGVDLYDVLESQCGLHAGAA